MMVHQDEEKNSWEGKEGIHPARLHDARAQLWFRLSASLVKLYFFSCLSLQLLRHSFLFIVSFSSSSPGLHPSCIFISLSCILPPLLARLPSLISPPSFPVHFSASRSLPPVALLSFPSCPSIKINTFRSSHINARSLLFSFPSSRIYDVYDLQ